MARRSNGEGTVSRRKDGRWVGAAYVETAELVKKRVYVYGKTRKEAHEKLTVLLKNSQDGIPTDSSVRLGEYLTRWLEHVARPQLRTRTYETYARCISKHIVPVLGSKRLKALTPTDIRGFLALKISEGLSPKTVQYFRAVLRSALTQAVRDGLVQRNVAALTKPPRSRRTHVNVLDAEDARILLKVSAEDRLAAVWAVALTLGLRRSEILGLTWSGIDFDKGVVHVFQGVQRAEGKLLIDELKTARSHRVLPLPTMTARALQRHKEAQRLKRLEFAEYWQDHDLVFCTDIGKPLDPRNLNRAFRSLLIRANVGVDVTRDEAGKAQYRTTVRLHDLRHSCASLLLALGVPPRVVMEILGHSGITITMNTYTHVIPTLLGDAMEMMNDLFDEVTEG